MQNKLYYSQESKYRYIKQAYEDMHPVNYAEGDALDHRYRVFRREMAFLDHETEVIEGIVSTSVLSAMYDARIAGKDWNAISTTAYADASKQAAMLFANFDFGNDIEPEIYKIAERVATRELTNLEAARIEELEQFEKLVIFSKSLPKIEVSSKRLLRVTVAEAFSEDPSPLLVKLIDDLGLEYEGAGAAPDTLLFQSIADELLQETRQTVGVSAAEHEQVRYISIDGGPVRFQEPDDPQEGFPPPRVCNLTYEDYEQVCREHEIERLYFREGWTTRYNYDYQETIMLDIQQKLTHKMV